MNALELIGIAANIMFFVIIIAGVLAMMDERKINLLQAFFYLLMETVFALNIFLIMR